MTAVLMRVWSRLLAGLRGKACIAGYGASRTTRQYWINRTENKAAWHLSGGLLFWGLAFGAAAVEGAAPPLGLPPSTSQSVDADLIALGKRIFFDKTLSVDGSTACASCHRPEHAFSDPAPRSTGFAGRVGVRNAPSLLNVRYQETFFWDGRRSPLRAQVIDPLFNGREHGWTDPQALLSRIGENPSYQDAFKATETSADARPTIDGVAKALESYIATLLAGDSPFDRYRYAGERQALSEAAQRGMRIFEGRGECAGCHRIAENWALFTDDRYHAAGVGLSEVQAHLPALIKAGHEVSVEEIDPAMDRNPMLAELGRFLVSKRPSDIGKFKTPSLRNVALTAPYMHDGSVETLEEAIEQEIYYRGLASGRPIILTAQEKADLVAFLRSLTSAFWPVS